MKLFFFYLFFALVASTAFSSSPKDPNKKADEWVRKADEIRNPSQSYSMKIQVINKAEGQQSEFQVFLKNQDKTLIITKAPARDKGRNMLMLDRDFHAYVPNLKRSMRLSLAQKLSGQVSNGDISRTRWFGDYDAQIEKDNGQEIQLLLRASKENLTYAAIRLWVEKSSHRPLRTEYLASNGKTVLKKAFFENYKNLANAQRPSVIRIVDAKESTSIIQIQEMKNDQFEDSFFTVRSMESQK